MTLAGFSWIVLIAVLAAGGQYLLKIGARELPGSGLLSAAAALPIAGALACYVAAFVVYVFLLQSRAVSTLYPLAIACTFVAIALMAWLVLREPISATKWAGIGLVAAGILLIQRG
jgi:multidrug transporter EmrE-like cation transporter